MSGTSEKRDRLGFLGERQLGRLDTRSASTNDSHLLSTQIQAIELRRVNDLALEGILLRQLDNLWLTARANGDNETVEDFAVVAIDDPAAVTVLGRVGRRGFVSVGGLDFGRETGARV